MKRRLLAFTVMEVVVVIAIIMILSGLTLLIAGPAIAKNKTEPSCALNLHQIAALCNLYVTDNDGAFPNLSLERQTPAIYGTIFKCPLTGGEYYPNLMTGTAVKNAVVFRDKLPDGSPIPYFDPEHDVLYRCLDHGFGGFTRGDSPGKGRLYFNSVGTVLGVRLDGTVQKVTPDSCWEFRYLPFNLDDLRNLWSNCDRPEAP